MTAVYYASFLQERKYPGTGEVQDLYLCRTKLDDISSNKL